MEVSIFAAEAQRRGVGQGYRLGKECLTEQTIGKQKHRREGVYSKFKDLGQNVYNNLT